MIPEKSSEIFMPAASRPWWTIPAQADKKPGSQ